MIWKHLIIWNVWAICCSTLSILYSPFTHIFRHDLSPKPFSPLLLFCTWFFSSQYFLFFTMSSNPYILLLFYSLQTLLPLLRHAFYISRLDNLRGCNLATDSSIIKFDISENIRSQNVLTSKRYLCCYIFISAKELN